MATAGSPTPIAPRPLPALAIASLVVGIVGELLSHIPLIGRIPALVLGLVSVALGIFAMLRNRFGTPGARPGIAVAGLTLGIVSTVDGIVGFSFAAATGLLVSLFD